MVRDGDWQGGRVGKRYWSGTARALLRLRLRCRGASGPGAGPLGSVVATELVRFGRVATKHLV